MQIKRTTIEDLLIIQPQKFSDERGWFMESFNAAQFEQAMIKLGHSMLPFVQDNHSLSHKGVLRGLHYQLNPYAQGKLVRVVQGRVWDVAVDIRQGSKTFGQWVGVELSAENKRMFWIPAGFAHGFIALEDNTQFLYKTTDYYAPEFEYSLQWNDPALAIKWPVEQIRKLILSEKDQQAMTFAQAIHSQSLL